MQEALVKSFRRPTHCSVESCFLVWREAAFATLDLDSGTCGEVLKGFTELKLLHPHQKVEGIATDIAHPAAEGLAFRVDLETGAGVFVPRTDSNHGLASATQGNVCPYKIHDVDCVANTFLEIVATIWQPSNANRLACCKNSL